MDRRGYVVTRNDHALFPRQTQEEIERRARAVVEHIEAAQGIQIPAVRFAIRAAALGLQTPSAIVSSIFRGQETATVRILVVAGKVAMPVLRKAFDGNELLVVIEESPTAHGIEIHPGFSRTSCRIVAHPNRSARLIEDLIIDVSVGTYFRGRAPLANFIDLGGGLAALYARKLRFARRAGMLRGPTTAKNSATYVMFSMLSPAADGELAARAQDAFATWQEFTETLTPLALPIDGEPLVIDDPSGTFPFAQLQTFGAQLSIRSVRTLLNALSPGSYVMAVLRSASAVRKSPELRDQIRGIFGERSRINSLRIYSYDQYLPNLHTLRELSKSGHIVLVHFVLNNT